MVFRFHIFVPGDESTVAAEGGESVVLFVEVDVVDGVDDANPLSRHVLISVTLKAEILLRILTQIILPKVIVLYRTPPLNTPNSESLPISKTRNRTRFKPQRTLNHVNRLKRLFIENVVQIPHMYPPVLVCSH